MRYEDLTHRQRKRLDIILNVITVLLFIGLVVGLVLAAQTDMP